MAYNEFAYFYDEFNGEADYDALYAHIRAELQAHGIQDGILADLGCGTGELTLMLTQAGYDMIGIDQSEEMLCVVRDKAEQLGLSGRLLLLRQDLLKLDLYGTIRGAVSTFDTFNDHFIDIPFDLSHVFFITTANDLGSIPGPLRDRMDVIELPSYTRVEKYNIARKHLLPKQLKACGLTGKVTLSQSALYGIIDGYTREAGVRNLERTITSVLRKCARKIASGEVESVSVTGTMLEQLLGPRFIKPDFLNRTNMVGVANGLAWTSVGGETLPIEVQVIPEGSGKITVTGSLGDVMKESAQLAITWVRVHAAEYGIDPEKLKKCDLHIHAPEGAVPKDGPSAGVTLTTALVSCLSGIPVRGDVAMTGEITLHGNVLPIGGLREKSMAAYREGMKTVLIPKDNEPDLYEVDDEVKKNLTFLPMQSLTQVLNAALLKPQNAKKTKAPSRTHAKKKAADAAIVPPTAEKPQSGAVC